MRAYLLALAAGTVATLLGIGLVNWIVDPYGIYDSPRIEGFNRWKHGVVGHQQVAKAIIASRQPWEGLIVGTSRAEVAFDSHHPIFRGPCFNAATGGQSMGEGLALVEAALRKGALKQVVAQLDFEVFQQGYEGFFEKDAFRAWRAASLAFSGDAFARSIVTPLRQNRVELYERAALWTDDGRFEFPPPALGHHEVTQRSELQYLRTIYFPRSRIMTLPDARLGAFADFRRLVALAHARGLALHLVIPPAHARQWDALAAVGLWPAFEEWKRRLVAIRDDEARKAGKPPVPLWDFSGYTSITTEPFPPLDDRKTRMKWYWESSHFNKAAGDLVLDRIAGFANPALPADFGVQLTAESLEPQLARVRAAQLTWRAAHPADAAEIGALAAASARWRASRRAAGP